MKDYVIWLKGGNSIEGTASEDTLDILIKGWKEKKCGFLSKHKLVLFKDEDGKTIIDLKEIQGIAINNQNDNKNLGF